MSRMLVRLVLALAVIGSTLTFAHTVASSRGQQGGILRIAFSPAAGLDYVDPALSFTQPGWSLLDTTCARLMTYPDKPPPAGFRLEPEVAAGYRVSNDFKTYTFTLRKGFRFSNGAPVRANAFARAIERVLQPFILSPGAQHAQDIVGARDVLEGRRARPQGVVARGNTLVVRFTKPAPDFPARTAMPFFCAVPPNLPSSGEGIGAFPSAGPYFVQEYRAGERVVIRRNPYYGGARKVHVDGFDVDLRAGSPQDMVRRIDRNEADWGHSLAPVFTDPSLELVARHGVNRGRFFVKPGLTLRMLAFNASRPLFAKNPRLRQAVNHALDRNALLAATGGPLAGQVTDQYLPQGIPGFRDASVYPLERANLRRARALARGSLRRAKAVFYTTNALPALQLAQLVAQQVARIGLELQVKPIPLHISSAAYLEKLAARGEEWDLALVVWTPNIPDPHAYLNQLLENQFLDGRTLTGFRSSIASRELRRASRTLQAQGRAEAYAELDAFLARVEAPLAALSVINEVTLVSDRVGCVVLRPVLDLAVACLKD
ncbi:MAG TPA: ABC transporter substrate-binding protein [Gaiellaceae bacterium]|jgi:peptide/nickel transport system substrate-binding protein|nr:ABC transporter substrate-binding protein [Gaiellaceae bacterium]